MNLDKLEKDLIKMEGDIVFVNTNRDLLLKLIAVAKAVDPRSCELRYCIKGDLCCLCEAMANLDKQTGA